MFKRPKAYFFGERIATYNSSLNGPLEVWRLKGKTMLHSANANQSFDSLHEVFQQEFKRISLKKNPPQHVLLMGLGGGSVISILRDELKITSPIDVVELDPVMIEIAHTHFDVGRFSNVKIHEADAYDFAHTNRGPYDLIVVDLFNDNKVPLKFFDEGFNTALLQLLGKGKLLFNTIAIDDAYALKIEKLKAFYAGQNGVKIEVHFPNGDNHVLVITK